MNSPNFYQFKKIESVSRLHCKRHKSGDLRHVLNTETEKLTTDHYPSIISLIIFAESKQSGIPPPGCTEPPQKYKFLIEEE